mmetsp:Transcript_47842/g.119686  ORF Transcript_47842/g.119686 Transcript_47842/m.119686 type:complete len:235 (+) Transcript_47842:1040-1744(+)
MRLHVECRRHVFGGVAAVVIIVLTTIFLVKTRPCPLCALAEPPAFWQLPLCEAHRVPVMGRRFVEFIDFFCGVVFPYEPSEVGAAQLVRPIISLPQHTHRVPREAHSIAQAIRIDFTFLEVMSPARQLLRRQRHVATQQHSSSVAIGVGVAVRANTDVELTIGTEQECPGGVSPFGSSCSVLVDIPHHHHTLAVIQRSSLPGCVRPPVAGAISGREEKTAEHSDAVVEWYIPSP